MVKWIGVAGLMLALSLLISGCQSQPIEKMSIVYGIALEPGQARDSGKPSLMATYLIPLYKKDGFNNFFIEVKGNSTTKMNDEASLKAGGRLVDQKVQVYLIEQSLARKGITPFISQYVSLLNLSANLSIAVTETVPSKLLKLSVKKADAATIINDVISKNEEASLIPMTNLLIFARQLEGKGQDPVLPLIREDEEDKNVELQGLALFKDDRYVMPLRGYMNMLFFSMMKQSVHRGQFETESGDVRMQIERSKVSYRWQRSRKQMQVRLKVNGRLNQPVDRLTLEMNGPKISQMKSKAEKEFEAKINTMIRTFQRAGIDPIGFGAIARSQDRKWNEQSWDKLYPELAIQADVQISIDEERR
ncbi:Ger(x)C family spore germination C-terminal domain-containing protein [Paenibacillus sp. CF384]|uniref:Ger(x)C family spore germination protein n=1 Tax=Paenibacillus sp. CF384 TaxID=1884382 RepID=UPI0008983992|nr:Ger(x)C family spore germination C-terminal domain-containing protein [Paenibacillus sp. CF384]SDX84272.1 germination protein, Ger(x)C family [Paenibacillus sp. CF384]